MEKPFQREPRYIVLKLTDIQKYCTLNMAESILAAGRAITAGRAADNRPPFNSAVVEADWPEFDAVWAMIEARCTGHMWTIAATKRDPISQEAQELGVSFCCGEEERLVHEIAALRNVIQSGLVEKTPGLIRSWNKYFPDSPLTEQRASTETPPVEIDFKKPDDSEGGIPE